MRRSLAILAAAAAMAVAAPAPAPAGSGIVTRDGQQLLLDGAPYRMLGFNLWRANVSFRLPNTGYLVNNGTTLADTLAAMNGSGANVIRAWFFQQEVTPTTAGYNWAPFDKTLAVAAAAGFKVIAVLADEWGYEGPPQLDYGWYKNGYQSAVYRGTANGVAYNTNVPYRQYAADVVARYAGSPAIAAWELVNEAQDASANGSCPADAGAVMAAFTDDVAGLVKSIDPDHLVSLGTGGNGQCGTLEGSYQTVMSSPHVDLCSFHDYYGAANTGAVNTYNGLNVRVSQCAALGKPLYVGEVGIHANRAPVNGDLATRAAYLGAKMGTQFAGQGMTGYLPWQFDLRGIGGTGDDYVYGPGDPALAVMGKYAW